MDGFINGIIELTIDQPTWMKWAKNTALIVIHTMFYPLHTSDSLNIDNILSLHKLEGEGHP